MCARATTLKPPCSERLRRRSVSATESDPPESPTRTRLPGGHSACRRIVRRTCCRTTLNWVLRSTFALRATVDNLRSGLRRCERGLPTAAHACRKRERRLVPEGRLELPTPRL